MALYDGAALDLAVLLWGQVAVTAVQIMTHYSNDYFDLAADRANPTPTHWSGGSGILPAGLIAPSLALGTALAAGLLALVAALWLAMALPTGPLALPLLLLALFLAWSYSAPPLQLHSTGIGEFAAALLIAGLTPLVGYYLQVGRLALLPVLAVIPLVLLQSVMLMLIEFPDVRGDAAVGKQTLVVRLGPARGARLLLGLIALHFVLLPLVLFAGLPALVVGLLALFDAPALLWLAWRLQQGAWAQPRWWNWLGFMGVALVVGSAVAELVAFLALVGAG
jgi:1,4-dihydroxy-2-naphthoate octaprenyltransferase